MRSVIISVGQLGAFLFFIALAFAIARASEWKTKRRLILALTAYVLVIQLAIGISQKDAWPFTNYRLMHGLVNPGSEEWRVGFFGVDAAGREWRIDPYAWRSISDWHLQFWFTIHFETASQDQRDRVLQVLFERAQKQRELAATGKRRFASILGPLAAPQWWMFDREPEAPKEPYRKIRVYIDRWVWLDRIATGRVANRKLMGEWPRP